MSQLTALLDANVLHSYPLTNLLLELADARLFRPVWSAQIHAEWIRSVQTARPQIALEKLQRRRAAMDEALPDACVSGHEVLISALTLPDPDDRHVLAAAIRAKAQVIVTFNERDFPDAVLRLHGISPRHPDTFLRNLVDLSPAIVRARVALMLAAWARPPMSAEAFIDHLHRCGVPKTALALRELFAAS